MAETPNATEPTRFKNVIHQGMRDGRQANAPVALLGPGEPTRDEEADGTQRVGAPHGVVVGRRAEADHQGAERRPVEPQGADELDDGGPPVDPVVLDPEQPPKTLAVGVVQRRRRGGDLVVLQEGGGGEEDRPDEVGQVVRSGADGGGVGRERSQREADGTDREQDTDPPGQGEGRPPGRATRDDRVLAVPARLPRDERPVRAAQHLSGDERAKASDAHPRPARGHIHVPRSHCRSP